MDQEQGQDTEWANAQVLAERKWRSLEREPDLMKRKKKLLTYLANRGFTADVCYRAVEEIENIEDSPRRGD